MEPTQTQQQYQPLPKLNNDPLALILSIVAIVLCCGIIGLVINIVTLNMAKKGIAEFEASPGNYSPGSLSNMNTTKIISMVGIGLNIIGLILTIVYFGAIIAAIGMGEFQ